MSSEASPRVDLDLREHPHRRLNPLTGQWVVVSPHRTKRPWQGQVERPAVAPSLPYDPSCYLCPGNPRAGNARNPPYEGAFVFDNDFPALLPDTPPATFDRAGLLVARGEPGIGRVVCFSPRHDLTLGRMATADVRRVVDVWAEQYRELAERPQIGYVQIFENRGEAMGCSNPHPHGQIWASATFPDEPAREQTSLLDHRRERGTCLLCDVLALERSEGQRIVCANDHFTVLVPFWATWPFETLLVGARHVPSIEALNAEERDALADILRRLSARYDNLFHVPFPYSMGFHQRPTDGAAHDEWHLHAHFYPPLLRSATVRKFMVGYEMLATPQRDTTPESAAAVLQGLAETVSD